MLTTQSNEISESGSSGPGYSSSVEEGVARTTRTVRVSTPFALSLVRRLAELKATAPQKNPITEDEAADILVSMRKTTTDADDAFPTPSTSNRIQPLGGSSRATSHSTCSSTTNEKEPAKCTTRQKDAGRPRRSRVIVSRRSSSTSAVFVAKTKITTKTSKRATAYNTFRTNASKLLGTQIIKTCRKGTTYNSNISTLWRETSEEDKAAFGGWTKVEQKEYLIKLATGLQAEEKKTATKPQKKKGVKAATRIQPKRGVEGKAKK